MARSSIDLVENLCLRTEDFSNAVWLKGTGITITANTDETTDPLGGNTASKVAYNGGAGASEFRFLQTWGTTNFSRDVYSIGIWMKATANRTLLLFDNASLTDTETCNVTTSWQLFRSLDIRSFDTAGVAAAFGLQLQIKGDGSDNNAFTLYCWGAHATKSNRLGTYVKNEGSATTGPIRSDPSGRVSVSGRSSVSGRVVP